MYTNINFLKEHTRLQELVLIRDRKIALYTSVVLGIFLVITVGLFLYQLFLKAQLTKVKEAAARETAQLKTLSPVQSQYQETVKKLQTVNALFAKRGSKWDAITFFYGLLPAGSAINGVDLKSATDSRLELSLESASIFTYQQLSQVLQSDQVKNSGYIVELGTLTRGRDGIYRMAVNLVLAKPTPTPRPRVVPTPAAQ